jgi:large subunit ribosomal protein L3
MPKLSRPRYGSLQFYPRKRVKRALPRVNWPHLQSRNSQDGLLGFIGYKVGMVSAMVKDDSEKSMTKGKRITLPATIVEVPNMKIFSVRFYKNGKVMTEVVVSNDKELKRKVKVPKEVKKLDDVDGFDDVRVIVYSLVKQTGVKKTPDMIELAINAPDKLVFVKDLIDKEIGLSDVLNSELVDIRGITKGKGLQGPVRRFGISLKGHKSEKGVRRPGSIGPWHPAHVNFRVPMAGQLGTFSRIHYNFKVLDSGSIKDKDLNVKGGFSHYGVIKTNYVILAGSIQGPQKKQVLITPALRPTRKQARRKYEFIGVGE